MNGLPTLEGVDVHGKRVLLRADLNLPMREGRISDATRLTRLLGTLRYLRTRGAKVVVMSHFGRPKGRPDSAMSLAPVAEALRTALDDRGIGFAPDCIGPEVGRMVAALAAGGLLLLENLRFHKGEEANDPEFARRLAALGDIYVNDAFSCAHRAHASTAAITEFLPSFAGPELLAEVAALEQALERPERPVVAIVGGAKVSTKIAVLRNLLARVDVLVVGGAMANTFLLAKGIAVGRSLVEGDFASLAADIARAAAARGCELILPVDAVTAAELTEGAASTRVDVADIAPDQAIFDVGPMTIEQISATLTAAHTLLWNGPLGAFEVPPFDTSTTAIARIAARLTKAGALKSIAGGGDTVAALAHAGVLADFTYVSTAGGAFLEWLEGKELPGIAVLRRCAAAGTARR